MQISNRLATMVRKKHPAVGMWINLADPGVAQIAALAGYDFVLIDTEHNPFTESQVQGLLHALGGYDVTAIVRVRANREEHVKWVLDTGAGGVVIPSILDVVDARRAVGISKYHPLGLRGYGPNRASGYWARRNEYTATANENILLICQIELASALAQADEICQTAGIDAIWIGPSDLSQSLGHLNDAQHPEVVAAVDRVIECANRHGKPWGTPTGNIQDLESYVKRGGLVMTLGSDTQMLRARTTELVSQAHAIAEQK